MALTKQQKQNIRHRMEIRVRERGGKNAAVTWTKAEADAASDDIVSMWEGTKLVTKTDVPAAGIGDKELIIKKMTTVIDSADLFVGETLVEVLR